jgi:hypothetical protein
LFDGENSRSPIEQQSAACQGAVMIRSLQVGLVLLVATVLLVAPARADGDQGKSPEDVLKSFAAAVKKDDVRAMMSHVTRDSQSHIAGSIGLVASFVKAFAGGIFGQKTLSPEDQKRIDTIDAIMQRHGVSDALLKKPWGNGKEPSTDEERTRILVDFGESVKDKPAFVLAMLKLGPGRLDDTIRFADVDYRWFQDIGEAKVKDVKIDKQQAKSQVTFTGADGKEKTGTIYFKLESGAWKIDLIETNRNWPRPPPPPQVQPRATPVQPPTSYSYSRPGLLRCLCSCLRRR